MVKNKHHKTKRQQPRPKHKKAKMQEMQDSFFQKMQLVSEKVRSLLSDKDVLNSQIKEQISKIEGYYNRYDSIQLIGSTGLYLLDNLANLEKHFVSQMYGVKMNLDEDAEVIAEYALNFGLSMPNEGKETPKDDVVKDLRESLRWLYHIYKLIEMPMENDAEKDINWTIHSELIGVRGDGYMQHIQEVFKEMFYPHSSFFENRFGFSAEELFNFFIELEDRIICKIGDQNMVYGASKMHERWKKWDEMTYGDINDDEAFEKRDFSNGMFGDFFKANPDVPCSEDGNHFLLYQPDDYKGSEKIFWVWPQNDAERNIMEALSSTFGSNAKFIEDGPYKGNIMNGLDIYEKTFVKVDDRYYCFNPMIPHRNMFLIAEKLIKQDIQYYNKEFKEIKSDKSRDGYIERKVRWVMETFLPAVKFYSSVSYHITEDGKEKKPELDILGVSSKAIYVIEVKAHELTYKDRVGLEGTKDKIKGSIAEACYQCCRAKGFIDNNDSPAFGITGGFVKIDKSLPVYKIAVTFQHYSSLVGQMDDLIKAGLMEERYRDTWIVSLFDLMACSEYFNDEEEFISYLDNHKALYANHCTFFDELDVLNGFLNYDLVEKMKAGKTYIISYGHQEIDEDFDSDYLLPIEDVL